MLSLSCRFQNHASHQGRRAYLHKNSGNIAEEVKDKFEFTDRETILDIESGTVEMNNNQVTLLVD